LNTGKQLCKNYTEAKENASHALTLSTYLEQLLFTLQHTSLSVVSILAIWFIGL
jgi:hypothetical protein